MLVVKFFYELPYVPPHLNFKTMLIIFLDYIVEEEITLDCVFLCVLI